MPAEAWTLTAHLRLDAAADDRRLAPLVTSVALEEGCPIPTPGWGGVRLVPYAGRPAAELLAAAEAPLARAALGAAAEALDGFREAVARRRRRDALRIDRYFVELDEDLRRRAGDGSAKRGALVPERARRLATLRDDATLRARVDVVALLLVRVPVAQASLELLRRKRRRVVDVRWHPLLRAWQPLACEGCGAATRNVGACDDEVHLLCPGCVEARRCPRCERGAPLAVEPRLQATAVEEVVRVAGPACGEGLGPVVPARATPVARPAAPGPSTPEPGAPAQVAAARRVPVAARPDGAALEAVLRAAGQPLATSELQAATGLGATALRAALAPLIASGQVERTGATRATRYAWRTT